MPQFHFYVPEKVARQIRENAQAVGLSTSKYIAELIKREFHEGWPEGFFEEVVGGWQGEPLQRSDQGDYEARDLIRPEES